jgi:hypothetical protein
MRDTRQRRNRAECDLQELQDRAEHPLQLGDHQVLFSRIFCQVLALYLDTGPSLPKPPQHHHRAHQETASFCAPAMQLHPRSSLPPPPGHQLQLSWWFHGKPLSEHGGRVQNQVFIFIRNVLV